VEPQTTNQLGQASLGLFAAVEATSVGWVDLAALGLIVVVLLVSLKFWYTAFVRFQNQQELIPYQRSECVLGFVDLLAIFVVWLGSQIAVGLVLGVLMAMGVIDSGGDLIAEHGVLLLYLSAVFGIVSLLASGAFLVFRYKATNSFGLRFNQVGKQIGYGVVVFTMMFPPMLLLQWLLTLLVEYDHPVLSVLAEDPSFVSIFGCWAAAVLAAPFVEEFLFRGVFQHWLERLSVSSLTNNQLIMGGPSDPLANDFNAGVAQGDDQMIITADLVEADEVRDAVPIATNPYQSPYTKVQSPIVPDHATGPRFGYWPILISSASFALVHFGQGLAPIPLFFLAVGLGYLFRQTGSLIACITVHFLLNFYSMLVFTIMILLGETP